MRGASGRATIGRVIRVGLALVGLVAGCGPAAHPRAPADAPPLRILVMGNSHAALHDLPAMLAAMVEALGPGRAVEAVAAPGWLFLDERSHDPASLELLRAGGFAFVVLQAQRTSSSWRTTYSTAGAEALIRAVRATGGVPVLFPEWPRRGVDEARRIFAVHAAIARREPACVAPVGQAFDLARAVVPGVPLHADDGDHAARAGAFLAALVLAGAIAGRSPEGVPYLPQFAVGFDLQARLRHVAGRTLERSAEFLPCDGGAAGGPGRAGAAGLRL